MHSMNKYYANNNDSHFEDIITLGELLKSVREARGISLKEIASKTKIHMGILMNLEKNNFAELPKKPYLMGFVKSMSLFLEINPKRAIDLLEAAYYQIDLGNEPIKLPARRPEYFILQKFSDLKLPKRVPQISRQKLTGLFFGAFAIILLIFGSNLMTRVSHAKSLVKPAVVNIKPGAPVLATSISPDPIPTALVPTALVPTAFAPTAPMTSYPPQ